MTALWKSLFHRSPAVWVPRWRLKGSWRGQPVTVSTGPEYGGAIASVKWGNWEFINPEGHGGQLQLASFLDDKGGDENPTEAGSQADGDGPANGRFPGGSSTRILGVAVETTAEGMLLRTTVNPAYWLPWQGRVVSPDTFSKTVTLNGNVLRFDIAVTEAEPHSVYSLNLCAYLNFAMDRWHLYHAENGILNVATPPGKGEIPGTMVASPDPVIASDASGAHAFAAFHRSEYSYVYGWGGPYPQWDILFTPKYDTAAGAVFTYTVYAVFGSLVDVEKTLRELSGGTAA